MFNLEKIDNMLKNRFVVVLIIVLINLPFVLSTFDATNWSDDYQHTNLINLKLRFSPFISTILEPWGGGPGDVGHFAPVFALINASIGFISFDPRFFHLLVCLVFIATAYVLFRIIEEYSDNRLLAILSAILFSVNYYMGFLGMTWNTMNCHVSNTFTGALSLYFLIRFSKTKQSKYLFICGLMYVLSILNIENGFVFLPVLGVAGIFLWRKGRLNIKQLASLVALLFVFSLAYPIGSYLSLGTPMPLGKRFNRVRNLQNYAFVANDLFVKSTGLTILYNKLAFNQLKDNPALEEPMKRLLRGNDKSAFKDIPIKFYVILIGIAVGTIALGIFLLIMILTRIREENRLFVWIYGVLFFIYVGVFFRTDVANALSLFSSVMIAEIIVSLIKDLNKNKRLVGYGFVSLLVIATVWTVAERYDDCYQKAYYGISAVAVKGPDLIYQDMNKAIGRFAKDGVILFTHDYTPYHETTGFQRIGDMIGVDDFACLNATVYYKDLLQSGLVEKYKDETFRKFYIDEFKLNPAYKRIIVGSKKDAIRYLTEHRVSLEKVEAIYLSKDYQVSRLNDELVINIIN